MRWLLSLACLALTACGESRAATAPAGDGEAATITVFAAASLTEAFSTAKDKVPQVR